jgi:hypothetical protein
MHPVSAHRLVRQASLRCTVAAHLLHQVLMTRRFGVENQTL